MQGFSSEREGRNDIHLVAVLAQPRGVASALVAEGKVEADDPVLDVHPRAEHFDELLRPKARERPIESEHDGVLHARRLEQRQLLLQRGDRLRAVGRVQHAARMWLESDESGSGARLRSGRDCAADDVGMAEMHAVEAADGDGDRTDVADRQPEVCLQDNTFSGTKVRRSGSVWPSAISLPPASCARSRPGPGSGSTRTARP